MAEALCFPGSNRLYVAKDENGVPREDISPVWAYQDGNVIVTAHKLSAEEMHGILMSGTVYVAVLAKALPPLFVGDHNSARHVCADYCKLWKST